MRERSADFSDDPVKREKLMMLEKAGGVSGAVFRGRKAGGAPGHRWREGP